ncbi:hypothetical protein C2G38_2172433 [Gigaspora rosea]|uniref:Uncharacterized protein n=1 Tax=Gigaspora rosea TaxID=44941 RepID=A0A397VKL7_9GLOM|nr:hypothetical protein C2G38_2172433 [Gigaspora rosea]
MQEYIKEISRSGITTQQVNLPNGRTWEEKVLSTCRHISFDLVNHKTQLPYYYDLGALIEARAWGKSAKELIKQSKPQRAQDILAIAQRTYQLYTARGPSHLFIAELIMLYVLQRLLKADFLLLKAEAHATAQNKIKEILILTDFAGAQS